jgi:hypothetical protein
VSIRACGGPGRATAAPRGRFAGSAWGLASGLRPMQRPRCSLLTPAACCCRPPHPTHTPQEAAPPGPLQWSSRNQGGREAARGRVQAAGPAAGRRGQARRWQPPHARQDRARHRGGRGSAVLRGPRAPAQGGPSAGAGLYEKAGGTWSDSAVALPHVSFGGHPSCLMCCTTLSSVPSPANPSHCCAVPAAARRRRRGRQPRRHGGRGEPRAGGAAARERDAETTARRQRRRRRQWRAAVRRLGRVWGERAGRGEGGAERGQNPWAVAHGRAGEGAEGLPVCLLCGRQGQTFLF